MGAALAKRYAPTDRPRVAIAADGTLAAVCEGARVVVADVPSCAELSTLSLDATATEIEHAWIGTPPRLLVLSRYDTRSTIHLVDPFGPRTIAELQLESPLRLHAAVGTHALAIGPQGATIFAATDRDLTQSSFPARSIPTTAGAAGTQFVVALPGIIEEWDPASRLPKRRLKLARPAQITALGGSDRVVWMTTKDEPARIDVIPLVARGQPKHHDLPEPIAHVASHPRSDLIVCIGATSGRVWVVDLDGQTGLRLIGAEGIDRAEAAGLVLGRTAGVLAAQHRRPLAVVALERDEPAPDHDTSITRNAPVPPQAPARPRTPTTPRAAFASFRDRVANPRARTVEPLGPLWPDAPVTWRDDLIAWIHDASPTAPPCIPIDTLLTRYDLTPSLLAALALLYAAHLLGEHGVAPVDLARVAGWPDALGRGELADKRCAVYRDSRILLAPTLRRVLDELPPSTGTIVGAPGVVSLLGPCIIVAAGPLAIVAEACLSSIGGAILAAHDGADPHELVDEARAYGAVPMLRVSSSMLAHVPLDNPIILVADDEHTADQLGLPRLT